MLTHQQIYHRHRSRQQVGAIALASLGSLMLWGCAKENTGGSSPAPATGGASTTPSDSSTAKSIRIAVIPKGTANSFWLGVKAGADAAAKETPGVEIIWQGPEKENDPTQQVDIVQTQINNHVDGIVLAAVDSQALVQPVKDASAKKIQVVTVDSGLTKGQDASICYIATDNTKGGQLAAEELAKATGQKGNVGILIFKKGSASNDERENGFLETIKKYPAMHVVSNLEAGDPTKAVDRTTDMLTANKDLVGIFAANQPNGEGAANVLKQKKLEGKVKLVAFDGSEDEMRALTDGTIQALIVQDPYRMGYEGVKTVLKAIHNQPVESKFVDSGVKVVTKENMNTPEMQKVLKPGG
jgi:ribose transport system substrate-binding protein